MNKNFLVVLIILSSVMVYAANFSDVSQSDFNGIYVNTSYDSSGFIQLNESISGNVTVNYVNESEIVGNKTGLVSYWRFNESFWSGASGEVKDVLGKNNGTVPNITTANTSAGLLGRAGNFSGTTGTYANEVQIKNSEELNPRTGGFTITGWARSITRGGNGYQLYFAKRDNAVGGKNGYYLGLLEGSGIKFVVGDGTNRVDTAYVNIDYTKWFHFAAVINRTSNQSLIYINGTLGASASISSVGNINNSWNLSIGNDEGQALLGETYQYPVKGQIDEVAIWNYSLNSSEILALSQKGTNSTSNVTTNSTVFTSGTYESSVKDAGSIVQWKNISWNGLDVAINPLTTNLANVVLMHLDGNVNDENGINNGTLKNTPSSVIGKNNLGYQLNGVNQYIEVADSNSLDLNSNFSIGVWVNFISLPPAGQWQGIITKGGQGDNQGTDHNFFLSFDNNIGWGAGVGITFGFENYAGTNYQTRYQWTPDLGKWYHIAGVFNDGANTMTLYINGTQVSQATDATGTPTTQLEPVFIGRNMNGSTAVYYLNAVVDDVFISNKSLSLSEIQNIYNSTGTNGIRFQFKTSNDNVSWSSYTGNDGTSESYCNSPGGLNLTNSRYVRYKVYFNDNILKLYNVTMNYDSIANLTVSLDSPTDNYLTNEYNINITCSASSTSQLANVTPYYSKFGWGQSEPAKIISGASNTTVFTLSEITSSILWNCYACNVNGTCTFSSLNRTIIGDIFSPEINLVSPAESYTENLSSSLNFVFNATDNRASSLSCKLLVDNNEVASNSSTISGINTVISSTISNGNYTWKINCSDGLNFKVSDERNLTLSVSSAYTPFWAKANTHTHTTNSDGDSSPTAVINLYKNKGYSIVAVTDHGFVTDCTPFTNLSANFLCVNSEEWTSTKHVVRVNVSSAYNNNIANLQNAVNAAQNEGGFAIAAHPNWSSTPWTVAELTSLQNYTSMEIYNKVIERLSPDPYAVVKWDEVLKTGKKMFGVAADDMHQVNVDLGYGFTKVYMPEFTKQAYINSMRTGYFYASQGPSMDSGSFTLICDETNSYHMGENANCSSVRINATISATNSTYIMKNITLIKDGNVLNITTCSSQNCSFSYSENVSSSGYYRLEATDSGNKKIWSNPIWANKIALPVTIAVISPVNNSEVLGYTPLFNISLNQQTSLWYALNNGNNKSLCTNCLSYSGYISLIEGQNVIHIYANNSDNIVKENRVYTRLSFNKSISESFIDNSSVQSTLNVTWSFGKMGMGVGSLFGNFILHPIYTLNNITSFHVEWAENNTENAKGEGQRTPIILKYRLGNSEWINTDNDGNYIINGSTISSLNGNNLSIMFDFEKNPLVPVDLFSFKIIWTEFTVPMIANVSKSAVTSSSAVISWNTDLSSNSSVLYGTTSSLGQSVSLNEFVASHLITLTGLLAGQGYSFRVTSCTESSCSQYPQEPYTPDSFTTQSSSVSPPVSSVDGGSGGGGGFAGNVTKKESHSLEIGGISDMVVEPAESRKMSLTVLNSGKDFLNDCVLNGKGENAGWISSDGAYDLSSGQIQEFLLNLNVPSDVSGGKYLLELELVCKEFSKSYSFSAEIIEKKLQVDILKAERQGSDEILVSYSLAELSGVSQQVDVSIVLLDSENEKIAEFSESKSLDANSKIDSQVTLKIPSDLKGSYNLVINAKSGRASGFAQEEMVIGDSSLIGGFTIFMNRFGGDYLISFFIIVVFGVFAFYLVRRILKFRVLAGYHKYNSISPGTGKKSGKVGEKGFVKVN